MSTLYQIFKDTTSRDNKKKLITIPIAKEDSQSFGSLSITYQKFLNDSVSFANKLIEKGIKTGDVVSLVITNGYPILSCFLGSTFARCIAAPLNSAYKSEEFNFYYKDMGANIVIVQKGLSEALKSAKELGIKVWEIENVENEKEGKLYYRITDPSNGDDLIFSSETISGEDEGDKIKLETVPDKDDKALFLHTSGSTGRPKGVPLTHENLATSSANISSTFHLTPSDCSYVVMPLFHVHGLIGVCLSTFNAGASLVVPPRFSASVFWSQVKQFSVNWYSAVPTIHTILCNVEQSATSSASSSNKGLLRFIRSSSSSLSPTLLETLEQFFGCPVIESYGMTEASHQMASNPLPQDGPRKPGSVGKGFNVQISIVNDNGEHQKQGDVGEVCIKGKNVMHGYHNNPQANIDNFTKDGWFLTGDIGYLDQDGYLILKGRKKEIINRGGEKISPLEVDNALLENDKILEAVCFGVPDEKYGEEIWAAVIPKVPQSITVEEITQFLQKKLISFKVPKKIIITDNFPKTASGKIQRRFIADFFLKQQNQ
ncbi:AMP-dependent synthetase and ligase domain-containing protein [Dictyostelium discoideum AX4]|uniref:AMP-dependent synthetase and ligase domain-containing protein n=1 Tax=Dictyostelium discoideum TaxID=44689 RepID=Q54WL7_DICDI|nr:AMP-dependent synthetase and ligase domain-containing protein [Dictyostelium discoideum AX4]EAL67719.1 AMP-dependent synthetase and ligase domain-containing protein [Dictyostelium discoideum AX4]|eukprot:XP_641700.1 AMP-dependent synthetase and ligase domain-containing protein [Dictyostelium discoideum AX4]